MGKCNTNSFVLELELVLDPHERAVVNKYLEIGRQIYNACLGEALKRLHKVQNDKGYQAFLKEPKSGERNKKLRIIEEAYGYSEYQLHEWSAGPKHHFHDQLCINEVQKLATRAFKAVEKLHYRQAKRVNFVPAGAPFSVENKNNITGLRWKDGHVVWNKLALEAVVKKNDAYASEAMKQRVKYIRILTRDIRGRRRYFVQLVLEGVSPSKNRIVGPAKQRVGIDPGVSTMAIASDIHVELAELAPNIQKDERKLARIQRAMDRSRRANNSGNYNSDGTIRKHPQKWVSSNRYLKLAAKRRELYRKIAVKRKVAHEQLANRFIELGLDVRAEAMQYRALQRRSKTTRFNPKNGRPRSKRRFGKTLQNRAPSQFLNILDRKLRYHGSSLKLVDTASIKASQYDHTTGRCVKKSLSERWTVIDGRKVQRDLYSAFLIACTTATLDKINTRLAKSRYSQFLTLHDREIEHIQQTGSKTLRWYAA